MRPLGNCKQSAVVHVSRRGANNFFAARLARVLVAIAGIFELWATLKVFEDQLIGSATHDRSINPVVQLQVVISP